MLPCAGATARPAGPDLIVKSEGIGGQRVKSVKSALLLGPSAGPGKQNR